MPVRSQLRGKVREALEYVIISAYFYFWSYKTEVRNGLKYGALSAVSLSTMTLAIEVVSEAYGSHGVAEALAAGLASTWLGISWGGFVLGLFVAAVIFLIWHNIDEARQPGYEYVFVRRLCDYLEGRGGRAPTRESLELFHSVFKRLRIAHVSLHLPNENELKIARDHVFPEEEDDDFFVSLAPGNGVAGRVYQDMRPRYVPRLFIPLRQERLWNWFRVGLFFPHAVSFVFRSPSGVDQKRGIELGDELVDFHVFKKNARNPTFVSVLSVPIKCVRDNKCLGVLNFDFQSADPLDKAQIAMAIVLGLLLGDEMAGRGGAVDEPEPARAS